MKNRVAQVLKIGSIAIFIISVFGALVFSNKLKLIENNDDSDSIYSTKEEYATTMEFDGDAFLTRILSATTGCTLLYAFGELIDLVAEGLFIIKKKQE